MSSLLLAELICSSLLVHLTYNVFMPRRLETTEPENVSSPFRSLLLQFYDLPITVSRISRISLKHNKLLPISGSRVS